MMRLPGFGGRLGIGASRSSSSSEDVFSSVPFLDSEGALGLPLWSAVGDKSNIFGRCKGRLSGCANPAAALVLDLTP